MRKSSSKILVDLYAFGITKYGDFGESKYLSQMFEIMWICLYCSFVVVLKVNM